MASRYFMESSSIYSKHWVTLGVPKFTPKGPQNFMTPCERSNVENMSVWSVQRLRSSLDSSTESFTVMQHVEHSRLLHSFSSVRPLLEYAVSIWDPYLKKDILALESVQRLATKICTKARNGVPYEDCLNQLSLTTLESRRKFLTKPLLLIQNIEWACPLSQF